MVYDKQTLYVHLFVNTLIFRLRRKMFCFARKKNIMVFSETSNHFYFCQVIYFFPSSKNQE